MRRMVLVLLITLTSCRDGDRPDNPAPIAITKIETTQGSEVPRWAFGWYSERRDPLPPELDSLRSWGDYYDGNIPVAYKFDLNLDGDPEYLVRADTVQCGQFGGCPTKLITRNSDGRYIDLFGDLAKLIYVTDKRVNGWPVLWVSYGGLTGGIYRMQYENSTCKSAGTIRSNKYLAEWTAEQHEQDTLRRMMETAPIR